MVVVVVGRGGGGEVEERNAEFYEYLGPVYLVPSPRANFTVCLHGKYVSRVMVSCPSQQTEISACTCSAWHDLARLGELTRLKPFT